MTLSADQQLRLAGGLGILLRHDQLRSGQHEVLLTAEQAGRLGRATRTGGGVRLALSPAQLRAGGGFLDQLKRAGRFVKSAILGLPAPRETVPPAVRSFLQRHGAQRVVRMAIGRLAIGAAVGQLLNLLSAGRFAEVQKQLGYTHVWHTFLVLTLSDGQQVALERNHVVELHGATAQQLSAEHLAVPLYASPTLSDLVLRAQKRGGPAFWLYSHEATNCQALVSTVLQSSPEVAKQAVHEAESFYRQNAAALADALGVVGNEVAHRLTQLAASGDRLLHGDGVRARRRRSK